MNTSIKTALIFLIFITTLYSKTLDKVSIKLQWLDQFQFAGYYMAKEKGFYNEAGLDVEILKYTNSDSDIINDVITRKATFATGRTSLLIHKNEGKPVVALAAIFQHSPSALLVTNKNIVNTSDLINKKIMISDDAISSASYMSMLFSEGINRKDLIIQKHSYNINDLINGKTDAIASYISNEPYKLEKKGIPYKIFHPRDYGFDFYGDILYTSKQEYFDNPIRVKNFTKASLKGWDYAFNNIEESAKLIFEKYNTQQKSLDELIYEGRILKNLAYDENNELGHIDKQKFAEIAKIYRLLNLVKKDYNLDDFIYHGHCDTDDLILTNEERAWLNNNKHLNLGFNIHWKPVEFIDDNNKLSGITEGYKELIEQKLNIQLNTKEINHWHKMIDNVKDKKIDLFLAIVKTPKREKYLSFTKSYLEFPVVIVTQNNIAYVKDLQQLDYKKIAVEKKFYTEELIKSINRDIELIPVNTTKDALELVSNGNAYAYIGALPTIGYIIQEERFTNLKINGEAPFSTKLSFATREDLPVLYSILQKTIASITKKEHDEIYSKWVNLEYVHTVDYTIILIISLFSIIILLIFYIRNKELKNMSETDSLTKLANRRKINYFLDIEIERSQRNSQKLSIIMIDVDFFKNINDTYGHKKGDTVLVKLSKVLSKNTRKYDLVGRWGGEEFLIVCPNSNLTQTISLCKNLQKVISLIKVSNNSNDKLTVSFGVAEHIKDESFDNLIHRADTELYRSKENGRNCIHPKD